MKQELKEITLVSLAQESLDIQNASNLCGLAQRFAQVMKDLNTLISSGTDDRNRHSIVTLWLDKFNSLNGIQFDEQKISDAYNEVYELTKTLRNGAV